MPLDVGVKLTGTVGRNDIGVLGVRTATCRIVEEKTFFVGRVKRNFLQQSYVGRHLHERESGIRDSRVRPTARTCAWRRSRFLGGSRNFVVNAFAARSVNEGPKGRDWSYGFSAEYPNDKFAAQIAVRDMQENFRPALGFVQRDNVRLLRMAGSYNPRPKSFLNIQQMFHDVYYTQFTRLDNEQVESWDLYITPLDWHLKSGDNFHSLFDINPTYERLFEPFEIAPGVVLPVGEYRFTRFRNSLFSTATKRRLSGSAAVVWGNYWSGEAEQVIASLTYKLPPWFTFSINTNQTFARLPEGHFTARIFSSNVNFAASPRLSLSNLIQYRQPVQEPGLAEPPALDAAARQRFLLRLQPGLDPGGHRRSAVPCGGQEDLCEVSVLVPVLTGDPSAAATSWSRRLELTRRNFSTSSRAA